MSIYHTGLTVACEEKECKVTATFENPGGYSDAVLEGKAMLAGWYIARYGGLGKVLCPAHHKGLARKLGWESLYEPPKPRGVPVIAEDRKKPDKEGAD